MKCRFCNQKNASSKEHLVANRRLSQINSFKDSQEVDDRITKTFKKITCESCNNELGRYEDSSYYNLAQATIWKILAGNINNAFERYPGYVLNNSSLETVESYERLFFNFIKNNQICPDLAFTFNFDSQKSIFQNRFGEAVKKINVNILDENGSPIEDAIFYSKDKFPVGDDGAYIAKSNSDGFVDVNILARLEKIIVATETCTFKNLITNETIEMDVDFIIYISFDLNEHRLIFILPLIGPVSTGWPDVSVEIKHVGFLVILQKHLKDIAVIELNKYFHKNNG